MTDYYVEEDEYESFPDQERYGSATERDFSSTDGASGGGAEGGGTWIYLAVLGGLFVLLTLFSFACNDGDPSAIELGRPGADGDAAVAASPARLLVGVNADVVTLDGVVPDEDTKATVIAAAEAQYGQGNVVDQLEVDSSVVLDDGVMLVSGRAAAGDARPAALQEAITSELNFVVGDLSVERTESGLAPMEISTIVEGGQATLSGLVPDQSTLDQLVLAAEIAWEAENVDTSGLSVGSVMLEGGTITASGSVLPGDERHLEYERFLTGRFGSQVIVDVSAIGSSISADTLAELEARVSELVTGSPILFAPRSAEIDAASDQVLQDVAVLLEAIPGVPIEIVGHTDDQGDENENLELSRLRAEAVVTRLEDLGIDGSRLSPRGEGQALPLVDNDTPENRALNRRIEFIVVGAADQVPESSDETVDGATDETGDATDETTDS